MVEETERLRHRRRAAELIRSLAEKDIPDARALVGALQREREFELMARLLEVLGHLVPHDLALRRRYAQALIELGMITAAIDVIDAAIRAGGRDHEQWVELQGLRGRAYKQLFVDARRRTGEAQSATLAASIEAYRKAYVRDKAANFWHGVNLIALACAAKVAGVDVPGAPDPARLAREVDKQLKARARPGYWELASRAEAAIPGRDFASVEGLLRTAFEADVLADPHERQGSFGVASTLRQFTELYGLDSDADERARRIPDILRAHLARLQGGALDVSAGQIQALAEVPAPDKRQLEAVLGKDGPVTWQWWQDGLVAARSVAAVRTGSQRFGSGFLVQGGALKPSLGDEPCVLTNYHVVNREGMANALNPAFTQVAFEAVDANHRYQVSEVVWQSPVGKHDAALLRLSSPPKADRVMPLALLPELPEPRDDPEDPVRLYVIGHPGGDELAFSFRDNVLLDHEDRQGGRRADAAVCRVHYRTPTKKGSSGSPVFEPDGWRIIALHHAGEREDRETGGGMPRLNGMGGLYSANEGISIGSIREAIAQEEILA